MNHTFPDRHGRNRTLDCILPFVAVLAVEVDAELIVLAFPGCPAHFGVKVIWLR